MDFRITGLDPAPFAPLYGLPDERLAALGVERITVDHSPGYPDRIELRDAAVGERVLLLNHVYLDADSPYRGTHAIFVREGASRRYDRINEVPGCLTRRLLSVRAFDARARLIEADVCDGAALGALVERLLGNPQAAFLHLHHARQGCYAARVDRVA